MAQSVLFETAIISCNTPFVPVPKRRIHVLFHDAGGGHRNAAVALKTVCEQQSRPWEINPIQFQEVTDHLDVLRRLTGIRIQEQYNVLLRNGWTWGSEYLLRVLQLTIRIFHRPMVNLLANYWREHPADLLISVIRHGREGEEEGGLGKLALTPYVQSSTASGGPMAFEAGKKQEDARDAMRRAACEETAEGAPEVQTRQATRGRTRRSRRVTLAKANRIYSVRQE